MNSRTLIMLAVAALVIVIAVKMNRNPDVDQTDTVTEPAITDTTTGTTDDYVTDEGVVVEEGESAVEEPVDPAVGAPAVEGTTEVAPTEGTDAVSGAETMTPAGEQTETTVGGEPITKGETEALEPATVGESPAESLETGPAEEVAEEPVTPRETAPATE